MTTERRVWLPLVTAAFGPIDNQQRLGEFLLALAFLDAAVAQDARHIAEVATWFRPEAILDPLFRGIVEGVLALKMETTPRPDALAKLIQRTLRNFAESRRLIVGMLQDACMQRAHLVSYALAVDEADRRRRAADELGAAAEGLADAADFDEFIRTIPEIGERYARPAVTRTEDQRRFVRESIAELEGAGRTGFAFGIGPLDRIVKALPNGALGTIGARTGSGKTAAMGQAALRCASHYLKPCLYFSLEMTGRELIDRWAAQTAQTPIPGDGEAKRDFLAGLAKVDRLLADGLLHVFDDQMSVEQIAATAKAYCARLDVGLIVVDYLQAVSASRTGDGRERQIAHIAQSLKALAMTTGVPVLTGSQLNRDAEEVPRLSHMRESDAIANYSNVVILLSSEKSGRPVVPITAHVAKNRSGRTDIVELEWSKPTFTIREKGTL